MSQSRKYVICLMLVLIKVVFVGVLYFTNIQHMYVQPLYDRYIANTNLASFWQRPPEVITYFSSNGSQYNITTTSLLEHTSAQSVLIYNAVPKCGSQTMQSVVTTLASKLRYRFIQTRTHYDFHLSAFHYNTTNTRRAIQTILKPHTKNTGKYRKTTKKNTLNRGKYIYYRHVHFMDFAKYNVSAATPLYINMIRDPVEQYISWYYYRRTTKCLPPVLGPVDLFDSHVYNTNVLARRKAKKAVFRNCEKCAAYYKSKEWKRVKNMTFDECVQTGNEECADSSYTFRMIPFFCGMQDFCVEATRRSLEQAMRNVERFYPLVGYLENISQYFQLAEVIYPQFFKGAQKIYTQSKNSHKNNGKWHKEESRLSPSEGSKAVMRTRLRLEFEFYQWIKQRFAATYNSIIKSS